MATDRSSVRTEAESADRMADALRVALGSGPLKRDALEFLRHDEDQVVQGGGCSVMLGWGGRQSHRAGGRGRRGTFPLRNERRVGLFHFGSADSKRSAGPVDIASMVDSQNPHDVELIVDLVDDSKVAPPSAVLAFQVEAEGSPDPMWVLGQPAVHELDAGGCDLLGQTIK